VRRWQAWLAPEIDGSCPPTRARLRRGIDGVVAALAELEHEPERLVMVLLERVTARSALVDGQMAARSALHRLG